MFRLKSTATSAWKQSLVFAVLLFAGHSAIADLNQIPSGFVEPTQCLDDDTEDYRAHANYFGLVARHDTLGRTERVIV